MKKALLFCALTVCALCGGYTPVLAEGEVETPSVVTEGDSILRSTVIVTRREELTPEEAALDCHGVLEQPNAIYQPTNGVIPHLFSVNDKPMDTYGITKYYVCFSKGNLQYMPESVEGAACWRFAERQYDCINRSIPTKNIEYGVRWDVKDFDKYSEEASWWYDMILGPTCEHIGAFGTQSVYNGGGKPNQWRVLTRKEWNYLFQRTSNGKNLFFRGCITGVAVETANGVVNQVDGVFFLPDDFEMDFILTGGTALADWCTGNSFDFAAHEVPLADYERLEEQGVIFLLAGRYYTNETEGWKAYDVGLQTNAQGGYVFSDYWGTRYSAYNCDADYVRFVQDVTYEDETH